MYCAHILLSILEPTSRFFSLGRREKHRCGSDPSRTQRRLRTKAKNTHAYAWVFLAFLGSALEDSKLTVSVQVVSKAFFLLSLRNINTPIDWSIYISSFK